MIQRRVVGVVGMGNVGTAAAFALFADRATSELVLVDKDHRRAEGEALDLAHGQAFVGRTVVRAGTWEDLRDAQVVVIAAGVSQRPGETRLDLLQRNVEAFRTIGHELDRCAKDAVLVVATNPVDVLTQALQEASPRPSRRILGTGTMLDTARFRASLGTYFGVSPTSVHAYILGEHGDSEVPVWSSASVGGVPVKSLDLGGRRYDAEAMGKLFRETRDAAYAIIERKGYTNLAIGLVIARLVAIILEDERAVVPVSVKLRGEYGIDDVCLSLPALVGRDGVESTLPPELDADELGALRRSAAILRDRVTSVRSP